MGQIFKPNAESIVYDTTGQSIDTTSETVTAITTLWQSDGPYTLEDNGVVNTTYEVFEVTLDDTKTYQFCVTTDQGASGAWNLGSSTPVIELIDPTTEEVYVTETDGFMEYTAVGNITRHVRIYGDASGGTDSGTFTFAFRELPAGTPLAITDSALPDFCANSGYSYFVAAEGGTPPYTWSVDPALPTNFNLDESTGEFYTQGGEVEAGTYIFDLTVTDDVLDTDTVSVTVEVFPVVNITNTELSYGIIGQPYLEILILDGGTPVTTTITGGALPTGLSLDASNQFAPRIWGTPESGGYNNVTFTTESTNGCTKEFNFDLVVIDKPIIITPSLKQAYLNEDYLDQVQAINGIPPYTWQITEGVLPRGLYIRPQDLAVVNNYGGQIYGTPLELGTFIFTVQVTDTINQTDTKEYVLIITEATKGLKPRIISEMSEYCVVKDNFHQKYLYDNIPSVIKNPEDI